MANKLTTRTWPWMTAATVLVAGFMYWLYAESSTLQTQTATAPDSAIAVPRVADTTFVKDPTRFSRQRVLVSPVTVAEQIGRAALTVNVSSVTGYPLILDRLVVESGVSVVPGDQLAIAGQVFALNDSLIDVYRQRGFFDPDKRDRLEGHSTFFLVDSLDFVFPGQQTSGGAGS